MSRYRMEFYLDWCGVQVGWKWMSKRHFQAGREFIRTLEGIHECQPTGDCKFFYIAEDEEQFVRLIKFRQDLERQWRKEIPTLPQRDEPTGH